MPCKLGLNNQKENGGEYLGKGMAKLIGVIREQLKADDYLDIDKGPVPSVVFYPDPAGKDPEVPEDMPVIGINTLFEDDRNYSKVECQGYFDFNENINNSLMDCKGCPYLL
jgi:hypothetical protein